MIREFLAHTRIRLRTATAAPRHTLWLLRRAVPRRVLWSVLVPICLLGIGTVGYPLIEGEPWTFFDGFYMTAITLTTIGYGELHPLSNFGRLFTVLLAYGGIFTLAYFMTELVRSVLTGELGAFLGRERMEEELSKLRNHLIVCGLGRMGKIVCDELERRGESFVVVDLTPRVPGEWPYKHGMCIHGSATEDEVLRRAGIDHARAIISVVNSDSDNLYITLSARLLSPKLTIIARAEEAEAEAKLLKVGASKVISPYLAGGHRAVQAVLRPTVLHFMEMATRSQFADLQLEEIKVMPGSHLAGKSLRESRLGQDLNIIVVGIMCPEGDVIYGPSGDTAIAGGAVLIVLGKRKQLERMEHLAGLR